MSGKNTTAITPTRAEDYPEWYQQVVRHADMAETSPVRGCMVIKPWGYALWENIRSVLDTMFKDTGHVNAYFPLFIPLSYLEKEAEHVEGFAKECAVVTHHRLEAGPDGGLVPAGKLEEPLVIRPTSETIIGASYAKWVQSYRDLPILINQWANVVRWEMRPRTFLRTTEFLWQEGHTVHETREEAWKESLTILGVYKKFAEDYMAMPVITGEKTPGERFPGAVNTFSIEAMMQDRKALQSGTSHFLGQNFAKSSEIMYQTREGTREYAWTTSWGVSTRLIGGIIMVHGDDNGVIIPPRLAPKHVVILPIIRSDNDKNQILEYCNNLAARLRAQKYMDKPIEVIVDARDMNAGELGWEWTKKGIPIRLEIGMRDIQKSSVFVARRDAGPRDKYSETIDTFIANASGLLDEIQSTLYERAKTFLADNTHEIDTWQDFQSFFSSDNPDKPDARGGFASSHWCEGENCEKKVNNDISVSIRCMPLDEKTTETGKCVVCGATSPRRVIFAKSY